MTGDAGVIAERRRELLRNRIAQNGLATSGSADQPTLRAGQRYRLSAGQRRMWFLQTLDPADTTLNIGVAYRLTGPLDVDRLRRSLNTVVARHTILRTTYGTDSDGEPFQEFRDDAEIAWRVHDRTGLPAADRGSEIEAVVRTEFARPFDLAADLPMRATLIATGGDDVTLVLVVHHICWDDDCWGVFFAEVSAAYNG
ncbi:MAG TPA: condensation domain-containing protein, partial [Mycobacterium sp.]|nr:condensation domain-containing protein [Mycobacterium sp.]